MAQRQRVIGIDVGTSGVRAMLVDREQGVLAESQTGLPAPLRSNGQITQAPELWWQALQQVLQDLLPQNDGTPIDALALDGTSSTTLLCHDDGSVLTPALMYNDSSAKAQLQTINAVAPLSSATRSASSSLAKALSLYQAQDCKPRILHQADWLLGKLCGDFRFSDENNALKLGYDVQQRAWPQWINDINPGFQLPIVLEPGAVIGTLDQALHDSHGLGTHTEVLAGTTDSTAAFLATGASQTGEAVTSLGSTMALKLISDRPIDAPEYGVYSHRLGDLWLTGGASNAGGTVLLQQFSLSELHEMTPKLKPEQSTGLDYYPLPEPGERFPHNAPDMLPRLTPRPDNDVSYFQGMLEGLSNIEAQGYGLLQELGAPKQVNVRSLGGGSHNPAWTQMRQHRLGVPMLAPIHSQAAYGCARLALFGLNPTNSQE